MGFCPIRCSIYTRRHFNVTDRRVIYGMCVGRKYEQMLRMHSKARKWSEKDARALTYERYRNNMINQMMRQGLAHLSPDEIAQRQELVKAAVELMNGEDQMQLVGKIVEKRNKEIGDRGSSNNNNNSNDDNDKSNDDEKTTGPRRSGRERKKKKDEMQQWNPITKTYEQVHMTSINYQTATLVGFEKKSPTLCNRSTTMTNNTIDIFDTYTGTGTTLTVMDEISRNKGIIIRVVGISEIDDELRERE